MRVSPDAMAHALASLFEEHGMHLCYHRMENMTAPTLVGAHALAYYVNQWYDNVTLTDRLADRVEAAVAHGL